MELSGDLLHIFFLPWFAGRGHTLPMVDVARLIAQRGGGRIRCSVVTTEGNSSYIRGLFEDAASSGLPLHLHLMYFPSAEVGLPVGSEGSDTIPPDHENQLKFYNGFNLLKHTFNDLVARHRPDCIVSDVVVYWAADVAHSFSIPHFQFCALSPVSLSVVEQLQQRHEQQRHVRFRLPDPLVFERDELPLIMLMFTDMMRENARRSCGVVYNTFYELAPEYVDHYSSHNLTGGAVKVWCVGPLQLCKPADKISSRKISAWLHSKEPGSVIYVGFGSECFFDPRQLREIALGLAKCRHPFLWVVRGSGGGAETMHEWLPEGFRDAVGDRGMIATEWVPQIAIMNHASVGGTVVHCGSNSILEALGAGLPVVAWPLKFEQFVNERFAVEVLRVGIRIMEGGKMRTLDLPNKEIVKGEVLQAAIDRLMGGSSAGDEEVRAMRRNANKYRELSRSAMEEGGSSSVSLSSLIKEIGIRVKEKKKNNHSEAS